MKKSIITEIAVDLYQRMAQFSEDSFVHRLTNTQSLTEHIEQNYQKLLNQYDSRIFFGEGIEHGEFNEYEYLSFNIIKIITFVIEELKTSEGEININNLHKAIRHYSTKCKIPVWLKEKLITYLPPLLINKYHVDAKPTEPIKYLIFLGKNKIIETDKAGLDSFRKKNHPGNFDIFIENTDTFKLLIKNNPNIFRAGNYHPFNILCLFLQRIGKSLTYNEIYHLAIKPGESKRPRDRSKKVYDYLKIIKRRISETKKIDIDPEKWFTRDHKKGIVHIAKSINGCLVIIRNKILA